MVKGASIKFQSYGETIPKLLSILKLDQELKKHDKIVLKPFLNSLNLSDSRNTSVNFIIPILEFCLKHKNPVTEVFIAEGADGYNTQELFDSLGYTELAEKYGIGLIDLNETETEELDLANFLSFQKIQYPRILLDSFVISAPKISEDPESAILASLSNMLGAYPSRFYSGLFSTKKNKIRKEPMQYQIHDILACKMPDFSILDSSHEGSIMAGIPLEMDKQALKVLHKEESEVPYITLTNEAFSRSLGLKE
jgi:uncharacterized protein (DUF362 family)